MNFYGTLSPNRTPEDMFSMCVCMCVIIGNYYPRNVCQFVSIYPNSLAGSDNAGELSKLT